MKLFFVCMAVSLAFLSPAQERFNCFEGSTEMSEGGVVANYNILSDGYLFTFIPPQKFEITTEKNFKRVNLTIPDKVSIRIQLTADYRGGLPGGDVLKNQVLNQYIGAAVLRSEICYTGGKPGWLVDVRRALSKDVSLITRHAFVPWPGGTVEVIISTNSEDFEKQRNTFANLLNSFQINSYTPQ